METQIKKSASIGELTKALIQFHSKCPKIPKLASNQGRKYADLPTMLELVQPVLVECELNVMQHPVGKYGLCTILSHSSGEWIKSTYTMQPLDSVVDNKLNLRAITPQSIGTIIAYQRRYAYGAILSLNIDDDNDAEPGKDQVNIVAPPKLTAQQILEAAKAAAAVTNGSTDQATTTTKQLMASEDGPHQETVHGPASDIQVASIKSMLNTWEQTSPGVSDQFVQMLHASGRNKIKELSSAECDHLERAITTRSLADFFDQSLQRAAAA